MHASYTSAVMAVATSNKADPPTSVRRQSKSNRTPITQLIAIANPHLGLRTSPNAKAFSDNKVTFKHQSCPENPHRRMWNIAESIIARIQVLEHFDQDYSHSDRSSTNERTLANDEAERSLYKIMEAALARVSVLEKRRDISYSSAFKVSNGTECIIRGCGGDLSKREHAVRHIKTTSTPEHQVAAIVLQQTECLECGRGWKTPSGLVHHETTLHGEAYTSRMDIFRPLFEQSSCTRLALMIRNMFAYFVQTLWVETLPSSHHIPKPTMPFQAPHFHQGQVFRAPFLLRKTRHHHLLPISTIFRKLLSTTRSQTGLSQAISMPSRTLYLQIRRSSLHLSPLPHILLTAHNQNGQSRMTSSLLQRQQS